MIDKCPECDYIIEELPTREPIPETMTGSAGAFTLTQTATTWTCYSYTSTSKTYKCSNPKCWVTKIKQDWE